MRLTQKEVSSIKKTVLEYDANAKVYLYGSRVDDSKRGGDIDLLIMSEKLTFDDKRKIKLEFYEKIGEQKIDITIAKDDKKPFVRLALSEGVML